MKKISFVLIIGLLFLCTGTVGGFSSHNITINRIFNKLETDAGSSIEVTIRFTNNEADRIRGFYFTEHIPSGLSVQTESVTINGVLIRDYILETGEKGAVYTNSTPFRWILETPPLFEENHPINPSDMLEVKYSVSSNTAGTFVFDHFSWTGKYQLPSDQTQNAFGHSIDSDKKTITFHQITDKDPPAAFDDMAETKINITVTIDVCSNDTDTDGTIDPASITITAAPSHGTVEVNQDGTATYTPNNGFTGKDTFFYTVKNDLELVSNEAMVSISINKDSEAEKKGDGRGGGCFIYTISNNYLHPGWLIVLSE